MGGDLKERERRRKRRKGVQMMAKKNSKWKQK